MGFRLAVGVCVFLVMWLPEISGATQTMSLPEDIFYSQCDPQWGSDPLGSSGQCDTICAIGVLVTCGSMLLSWVAEEASPNPGELNQWLAANGGYVGCNLAWSVVAAYDGQGSGLEWQGASPLTFDDWAALDAELDAPERMPVVMVLGGAHWVVVYERKGPSGNPGSYRVLDPGQASFSTNRSLADFPPVGGQVIFGLSVYSGAFPTPQVVFADGFESGTTGAWAVAVP